MRIAISVIFVIITLSACGCAESRLHIKCTDMRAKMSAQTDDQHAARRLLDLASGLEEYEAPPPIVPELIFMVEVSKRPEERPYLEIRVYDVHTRMVFFNKPDDASDDETLDLVTTNQLIDAIAGIAEYHRIPDGDVGLRRN